MYCTNNDRLPITNKHMIFFLFIFLFLLTYIMKSESPRWQPTFFHHYLLAKTGCVPILRNQTKIKRKLTGNSTSFPVGLCDNVLSNLTNGAWHLCKNYDKKELQKLEMLQNQYRRYINMPNKFWRADNRCGSQAPLPGSSNFASICDPKQLSCCTDHTSGVCIQSGTNDCNCSRCFDFKKLLFPSLANWVTNDRRCHWHNYTTLEACSLLNNLFESGDSSKLSVDSRFHFFGDSLVHNMYLGLLVLLTGRRDTGTWNSCLGNDEVKKLCYGPNQFYYMPCLQEATSSRLDQIDDGLMCGNQGRYFDVTFKPYFATAFKNEMLSYVSQLLDKPNNVITVGIGILERCRSEVVLNNYLKPLVELVKKSKTGWPKLLWVHPLKLGPVISNQFWSGVGNEEIEAFIDEVDHFLQQEKIPVFNFRKLTTYVHSHDGTHYGVGLNLMKVQIWLNYLASISFNQII